MYTVTVKGFETEWQARQFVHWYEGSGEQQLWDWVGCRDDQPEPRTSSMNCDIRKTYDKGKLHLVDNNVDLYLEMSYEDAASVLE